VTATVLVVEDEPDLAQIMVLALRRAGFGVLAVASGAAAVASAQDQPVAVVVIDRGLPDMDGLEATASLRAGGYRGAVLVTSGQAGEEHVAECLEAGADDVLGKPFTLAQLVARVTAALDGPADGATAG